MYYQKINIQNENQLEQSLYLNGTKDIWDKQLVDENIRLDQQLGDLAWSQSQWKELSQESDILLINLFTQNKLIGLLLAKIIEEEDLSHLLKLIVDSDCRRKGFADLLMREYKERIDAMKVSKIYLEVQEDNYQAIGCYEKHGVKKHHLQKRFYSNGKSAWKMFTEIK